ncbi:MAG: hypothetical protein ACREBE_09665 [bacterium]
MSARGILVWVAVIGLALPAAAGPTRYDPQRAGHPLRIAAYVLHPFGVILDTLIFHPAWWVGTHEPFRTLFGVQVQGDDYVDIRVAEAQPSEPTAPGAGTMEPESEPPTLDYPPASEPEQD